MTAIINSDTLVNLIEHSELLERSGIITPTIKLSVLKYNSYNSTKKNYVPVEIFHKSDNCDVLYSIVKKTNFILIHEIIKKKQRILKKNAFNKFIKRHILLSIAKKIAEMNNCE